MAGFGKQLATWSCLTFVLAYACCRRCSAQDSAQLQEEVKQIQQKRTEAQLAGLPKEEAVQLAALGKVYLQMGYLKMAEESYETALATARTSADRRTEASVLMKAFSAFHQQGLHQKALEYLIELLPIERELGDRHGEALTLNNIGGTYSFLGQEELALRYSSQALAIWREVGDKNMEVVGVNNLGRLCNLLAQWPRAIEFYNQALALAVENGNLKQQEVALGDIASAYLSLGEGQKALDYYNRSLQIQRQIGDRVGEASTLTGLGKIYSNLKQSDKALELYTQALSIELNNSDRDLEASTLNSRGHVYLAIGQRQKALADEVAALLIAKAVGNPGLEAVVADSLMSYFREQRLSEAAIYFGTEAVNCFQLVRRNMSGLNSDLRSGYTRSNSETYRALAELLVQAGRLGEAEQVLDLLKEQELREVLRGSAGDAASKLAPLPLTAERELAAAELKAIPLTALDSEYVTLRAKPTRTSAEDDRLRVLDARIEAGNGEVSDFFRNTLYPQLTGKVGPQDANALLSAEKSEVSRLQNTLVASGPRALGIRLLLGEDHVYEIVVSAHSREKYELKTTPAQLRSKVLQVRDELRTPASDPRPHLEELYEMLIGPMSAELKALEAGPANQQGVPTLLWSLDGVLRYLPMSALYDGKRYMAERFNNVLFTPESYGHMTAPSRPIGDLRLLAMGLSKSYGGLPPLPGVMTELEAVVHDPADPQSHGPISGRLLPNEQFTLDALKTELGTGQSFPVVHIASHFVAQTSNGGEPYLMLGGESSGESQGYALTLSKLSDSPITFHGTQLLTLSACSTEKGNTAGDGLEMDSLGMIAQQKDAEAVLATLWDVSDASTSLLMGDFYARWMKYPSQGKAEALRQAQLAFLHGSTGASSKVGRGSQIEHDSNAKAIYSHPFYWAPFVLTGNYQ
jgi:CHAT domain-containing protein